MYSGTSFFLNNLHINTGSFRSYPQVKVMWQKTQKEQEAERVGLVKGRG